MDGDSFVDYLVARHLHLVEGLDIHVVYFDVGDRRLERAAPVHQTVISKYQPLIKQLTKRLQNGFLPRFIQGECLPRPIQRTS